MPKKKEKKIPVFLSVSEMLSLQILLRKKIETIDEEVRNKRAMYEQHEALRERIHYFDDIHTKIYEARTNNEDESKLGLAQQRIFEWLNTNTEQEPLRAISNLFEFGTKHWFNAVEKDADLQEAFDTLSKDSKSMRDLLITYLNEHEFEQTKTKKKNKE
ncbi:hypothetical protein [Enterococcus faecium]|uniref:hypothetical protein n=1 Tax=Enterococcus faecium TaxID=1352 RepID=UPI0030C87C1A